MPKIVWKYFLLKFLPLCSSGDAWVHVSIELFYFMPQVLKSGNFITKKIVIGIVFSGNTQIQRKRKNVKSNLSFQKQAKITKKFWNFASPLLIFELTSFKFQRPSTKAPLSLITTLLFREFKDEHLSPVFTVLQLGTGS